MLWPKFESDIVANNLAIVGSIKDELLDTVDVAYQFIKRLESFKDYKDFKKLLNKYSVSIDEWEEIKKLSNPYYELLKVFAAKKQMLKQGATPDIERIAKAILVDYRNGRIGKITLEKVENGR